MYEKKFYSVVDLVDNSFAFYSIAAKEIEIQEKGRTLGAENNYSYDTVK